MTRDAWRPSPLQVERLFCAVFPSRRERIARAVAAWCWRRSDTTGLFCWLGDRADDLELWLRCRRAARRHAAREQAR